MAISEKSGQIFIAYHGTEVSYSRIKDALERKCPGNYTVNYKTGDNLIFAKVVYDNYREDRDPHWDSSTGILTVNGYNQGEIANANRGFSEYDITDEDRYQRLTNRLYADFKEEMFLKLKKYMHFCSVIWDNNTHELIAGVTEPSNNKYTHLYYGYTKQKNEIMFSNDKGILSEFCENIEEMSSDTYMKDGEFYTLEGNKIQKNGTPTLIKNDKKNADTLIGGLNALLVQVTNEAVKTQIAQNVEEFLNSEDPKKRIEDFILKNLDLETKKTILELIKKSVEDFSIEKGIRDSLNDIFNKQLEEYSKNVNIPVIHVIKLGETELGRTEGGFFHEKFEEVLSLVQLDEPIMLIGPAGSGKNHSIGQIAQALGLHMYYTNNASNEFKLTGFIDAGGTYRDTEFYKAFKNGGIFFLDEIDNSDPSALIVINSALANGYMAFPHETIDRHPDFRMVAAANTWGKGSDLQYVGRNALDGATLDRFDNVFFDYDRKLEAALYPNEEVLKFMWSFRDAAESTKTPHIVSTRGIGKVYKKEINGIPVETILRTNIIRNLGQDDLNTLLGSMRNIDRSNKYYSTAKTLKLGR